METDNEEYYTDSEEDNKNKNIIPDDKYENEPEPESDEEDDKPKKIYTIKSPEYIEYKRNILSLGNENKVFYIKNQKQTYYIKNRHKTKIFANNIKHYGNNLPIDDKHYEDIANDLIKSKKPIILDAIKLVEYINYETKDFTSLIEIIDGHHRILAIILAFNEKPDLNLSIEIEVLISDRPGSERTKKLFKTLNKVKPFGTDIFITDISGIIIMKLIEKFKLFIDIEKNKVNRPKISQSDFNQIIVKRLSLLETNGISINEINIGNIINEFEKYNEKCKNKLENWFHKNELFPIKKKISKIMLEKAIKINCFLGLVDLEKLVELCIK